MDVPAVRDDSAERYCAILRADQDCDGRFFYGVVTTGVYCLPSCSCRKPRPENVRFFGTRDEALAAGFRPCKRCRPDLDGGYLADLERRIQERVEATLDRISVASLADSLAMSRHHLQRLFRRAAGLTIQAHIRQERLRRGAAMLRSTDLSIQEVASAVGFSSASAFHAAYRREYGLTPRADARSSQKRSGGSQ